MTFVNKSFKKHTDTHTHARTPQPRKCTHKSTSEGMRTQATTCAAFASGERDALWSATEKQTEHSLASAVVGGVSKPAHKIHTRTRTHTHTHTHTHTYAHTHACMHTHMRSCKATHSKRAKSRAPNVLLDRNHPAKSSFLLLRKSSGSNSCLPCTTSMVAWCTNRTARARRLNLGHAANQQKVQHTTNKFVSTREHP